MIFKNSMKSIRRTPFKTVLFMLLIAAVTLFLVLSSSMLFAANRMIADADRNFSTIVTFSAPENYSAAPEGFDPAALAAGDKVLSFDTPHVYRGIIEGCELSLPDNGYRYKGVLSLSRVFRAANNMYFNATSSKNPFSYFGTDDRFISLFDDFVRFEPVYGHRYVVCGEFIPQQRTGGFRILPVVSSVPVEEVCGVSVDSIETIIDITDNADAFLADKSNIYNRLGELYNRCANSVTVTATSDMQNLEAFHQQELMMSSGRVFTAQEYSDAAKVCVISDIIAGVMNVNTGDKINMSLAENYEGYLSDSFWNGESAPFEEYEIVGIVKASDNAKDCVFVPQPGTVRTDFSGAALAQAHIENGGQDEYLASIDGLLPSAVTVSVYDQGYGAVTRSIMSMRDNAYIMMSVCLPAALAVLFLFAFIFVGRQRDNVEIMLSLGTGKRRAAAYLLYGAGFISLLSIIVGSAAAAAVSSAVIRFIYMLQYNSTLKGLRYSNGRLGVIKEYTFDVSVSPVQLLLSALVIICAAAVLCLFFAAIVFKKRAVTRKKKRERKQKVREMRSPASMLRGGAVKYALLSIKRGGMRSFVVPAATLALTIFLSFLATTYAGFRAKLNKLDADTALTGSFTDYSGKNSDGLYIPLSAALKICESGFIEEGSFSASRTTSYKFHAVVKTAAGQQFYPEPFHIPRTEFALESLIATTAFDPGFIYTNDISAAREFTNGVEVTYAEGYDDSVFAGTKRSVCAVPESFLENHGVAVGDTVQLVVGTDFDTVECTVIGSFKGESALENVYLPLSLYLGTTWPASEEYIRQRQLEQIQRAAEQFNESMSGILYNIDGTVAELSFTSAFFKLSDASRLIEFKNRLEDDGYSQIREVNRERTWIVFYDSAYNETRANLTRSISYFNLLYVLLFVLVGAFGFIISYLLVSHRKPEYAVMRGIGARKRYALRCFFDEQLLLSVAGVILGLLIWLPIGGISLLQLGLVAAFLAFYLIGCRQSVATLARISVISILTSKD